MRRAAPWLLLLLAVAAVYGQTLWFSLVWDDPDLIRHAAVTARDGGWSGVLRSEYGYLEQSSSGYWRPLTQAALLLNLKLAGGAPWALHLGSLLLYAGCVLAFHLLALRLLPSPGAALFASLLFALHPLHAESAAQVTNRHDLLAALFVLLSAWLWAGDRRGERGWRLAGGALCLLAAALAKEPGVLLPAALLLWDLLDSGARGWWGRNRRWLAAWAGAGAAYLLLRLSLFGSSLGKAGVAAPVGASLLDPSLLLGRLLTYLELLAAPFRVRIWYERPEVAVGPLPLLGAALFLLLLGWGGGGGRDRWGEKTLAWTAVFLLPASGVVSIGGALVAARHLFLASAGVCLLGGILLWELWRRRSRPAVAAAVALPVALLAASWVQASNWRDDLSLFTRLARDNPGGLMAPTNLVEANIDRGRPLEAERWARRGVEISPRDSGPWDLLGSALAAKGDLPGAEQAFRKAASLTPAWYHPRYNLGIVLQAQGRWVEAAEEYRASMELGPGSAPDAPLRRAEALSLLRRFGEAEQALRDGLALFPRDPALWARLGKVRIQAESGGGAEEAFRTALSLDPGNREAREGLVVALALAGRTDDARRELGALRRRDPAAADRLLLVLPVLR